jgi:hypothetical protein
MIRTSVLGEAVGIQWSGLTDNSETSSQTGLGYPLIVGQFKRGRTDQPMTVTSGNIKALLGYDPTNKDYIAVQAYLDTKVPSVQVLRIGDIAEEVLPAFIWPRSTDEYNAIKAAVISAGKEDKWNVDKWINLHNDPSVSNLSYSLHNLSLFWSYDETQYNDQILASGIAVNKKLLDNLIANYSDKNFNISPSSSLLAPLVSGEIVQATKADAGSLPIFAAEQYVLPNAIEYEGYYLFSNNLITWSQNYGYHLIAIWLKLIGDNSSTEDKMSIKML